jgi:hypothetical protein
MKHKIETISIDDLIPYVNNARTHDEAQVAQIAASIKEFVLYLNKIEERRVGKECLRLCRSRWSPYH